MCTVGDNISRVCGQVPSSTDDSKKHFFSICFLRSTDGGGFCPTRPNKAIHKSMTRYSLSVYLWSAATAPVHFYCIQCKKRTHFERDVLHAPPPELEERVRAVVEEAAMEITSGIGLTRPEGLYVSHKRVTLPAPSDSRKRQRTEPIDFKHIKPMLANASIPRSTPIHTHRSLPPFSSVKPKRGARRAQRATRRCQRIVRNSKSLF